MFSSHDFDWDCQSDDVKVNTVLYTIYTVQYSTVAVVYYTVYVYWTILPRTVMIGSGTTKWKEKTVGCRSQERLWTTNLASEVLFSSNP